MTPGPRVASRPGPTTAGPTTAGPTTAGPATAFGVDIGGTKVLGVALDAGDTVVAEARVATPHAAAEPSGPAPDAPSAPDAPQATPAGAVAGAVAEVVAALERDVGPGGVGHTLPVGVGAPGMLDRHGVLRFSPNLPGAAGADMLGLVTARLPGRPVVVENDANCAALGEVRRGAARGAAHALVVTLGTGIGGGVIADGRVAVGAHGFAGEIGHMLVDPSGPPCPCGRRGCWERYASGGGLGRLARESAAAGRLDEVAALAGGDITRVRGEDVTRAARAGDPGALAVMDELGWWVALGLANLTAVLDPERIVIGGGMAEAGETLLVPTRRAFAELVEGAASRPEVAIVPAALGERAGAAGAAMAARTGGLW